MVSYFESFFIRNYMEVKCKCTCKCVFPGWYLKCGGKFSFNISCTDTTSSSCIFLKDKVEKMHLNYQIIFTNLVTFWCSDSQQLFAIGLNCLSSKTMASQEMSHIWDMIWFLAILVGVHAFEIAKVFQYHATQTAHSACIFWIRREFISWLV